MNFLISLQLSILHSNLVIDKTVHVHCGLGVVYPACRRVCGH